MEGNIRDDIQRLIDNLHTPITERDSEYPSLLDGRNIPRIEVNRVDGKSDLAERISNSWHMAEVNQYPCS